ncbi:hypothetical protein C7S16_4905 [Burkholderia thailandensis]|uniref:Uncharacterized protein n=1 Tax=Burkholderia thailandensis TaxID=57975 RepID=A0AAW9CS53_BURTH|nr:hypothetical protein [Burkholderia thailandensis]MDW9251449.1 hypothetical protein [Burkholderia thailandensis]
MVGISSETTGTAGTTRSVRRPRRADAIGRNNNGGSATPRRISAR